MRLSSIAGLIAIAVTGMLAACGGPSKGEFVAACMKQQQGFQEVTEEMCACAADVARSTFSAPAYAATVLNMQGKDQEARAIMAKLSESDQMQMIQATGEMLGKCAVGKEGEFR